MQLSDDFTVSVPSDRLWELLNDVERVAPCVPGFTLKEAVDPDYHGVMKVKVGAITVQYDATITFVERDQAAKRVVLSVRGKELRGAGSVDATVTSSLIDKGEETTAQMVTDVQVTGRVAQFGRGIIADVGSRITEQFVERLNQELVAAPEDAPQAAPQATPTPTPPQDEELDLGAVAVLPVLKRLAPIAAALVLAVLALRLLRRR
jgi:carbon monoxide dehydrogenase subunit G